MQIYICLLVFYFHWISSGAEIYKINDTNSKAITKDVFQNTNNNNSETPHLRIKRKGGKGGGGGRGSSSGRSSSSGSGLSGSSLSSGGGIIGGGSLNVGYTRVGGGGSYAGMYITFTVIGVIAFIVMSYLAWKRKIKLRELENRKQQPQNFNKNVVRLQSHPASLFNPGVKN